MKKLFIILVSLVSFASAQDSAAVKSPKNPIRQFKVWVDGKQYDADDIDVICVEDNFSTEANFRWTLTDSTGVVLAQGFLKMSGPDYVDYITKPNHGQRAAAYVMRSLNLVSRPNRRQ